MTANLTLKYEYEPPIQASPHDCPDHDHDHDHGHGHGH
jgi:hypothetical protein